MGARSCSRMHVPNNAAAMHVPTAMLDGLPFCSFQPCAESPLLDVILPDAKPRKCSVCTVEPWYDQVRATKLEHLKRYTPSFDNACVLSWRCLQFDVDVVFHVVWRKIGITLHRSGRSMMAHIQDASSWTYRPTCLSLHQMRSLYIYLRRSMSWRRLPTYLANLRLRLMPFNEQQIKAYEETGHVKQIAFKTTPRVGKVGGPLSA